jgi:hypothetical protein
MNPFPRRYGHPPGEFAQESDSHLPQPGPYLNLQWPALGILIAVMISSPLNKSVRSVLNGESSILQTAFVFIAVSP